MEFVELFVVFFAVFGTAFLLHYTDGPGDIFFKFRQFLVGLDRRKTTTGKEVHIVEETQEEGFFQKLLNCFWCSSFWVALVIVTCYYVVHGYSFKSFPFVLLASIGVSGFLHESIARG